MSHSSSWSSRLSVVAARRDTAAGRRFAALGGVALFLLAACTSGHSGAAPSGGTSSGPLPQSEAPSSPASTANPAASSAQAASSAPRSSAASLPASASAAISASPSASNLTGLPTPGGSGPLHVVADVTIKGAFAYAQTGLVVAQGPDGAVFVAGQAGTPQIIWVVDGVRPAAVAEHVGGPVTALAADAGRLYVGAGRSITAYSRTTGQPVRSWSPASLPGAVAQLVTVGDRVWGLYTEANGAQADQAGDPGGLVELDPGSSTPVRTVLGVTGVHSLAAGPSSIYYVTKQSSELVQQTNGGHTVSAPTNQRVDLQLSGPSAIQAVAVVDGRVVVQHNAGQGLDAQLNSYDATTLAGPSTGTGFSAAELLAATRGGLLVVGNPDTGACAAGQSTCVRRFSLAAGNVGAPVALPTDALATTLTGPYPSAVVAVGSDVHVLRIS